MKKITVTIEISDADYNRLNCVLDDQSAGNVDFEDLICWNIESAVENLSHGEVFCQIASIEDTPDMDYSAEEIADAERRILDAIFGKQEGEQENE